MKITMTTGLSGPSVSLSPGDPHECDDAEAERLIAAGFATEGWKVAEPEVPADPPRSDEAAVSPSEQPPAPPAGDPPVITPAEAPAPATPKRTRKAKVEG